MTKLYSLLGSCRVLILPACMITLFNIASCTKTSNADDAKKFLGTWNGVSNCAGNLVNGANKVELTKGSDGVTAIFPLTAGIGSCLKDVKITGTAREDVLTFPTQTVTDACGMVYEVNGFGSIIGDSLSLTVNATSDLAAAGACNFRGKK
ncbi:MAG: hypothetical protein V4649_14480 [Bacteroidota bacterium]